MSNPKLFPLIKDGLYGLQDESGRTVLAPQYDYIQISDDERLRYRHEGYWGLLDRQGNIIVSHSRRFETLWPESYGFYSVSKNDNEGIIDSNGQAITPLVWEECGNVCYTNEGFSHPLIIVMRKEKYGAINIKGKIIIPFQYSDLYSIGDGLLAATLNEQSGVIDEKGNTVIPFEYDDTSIFHTDNGLIPAAKDGLHGCINRKNEVVIPFKYYAIFFCDNELLEVALTPDKKQWNCIDTKGNLLLDQPCKSIDYSEGKKDVMDAITLCSAKNGKQFYSLTLNGLQDLPSDGQAVYSADGKVILKLLKNKSKVTVKPGVEHICLVDWLAQSNKNAIREIVFLPGVTRIGKGWENLSYGHDANNPDLDIFLPASVTEIDPDAFTYLMPYLHAIYAPKNSLNHIMRVVPTYLTSYIKKEPMWWQRIHLNKEFLQNPFYLLPRIFSFVGEEIRNYLFLIALVFISLLGIFGYRKCQETMIPFHLSFWSVFLFIWALATMIILCTTNFNWRKLFDDGPDVENKFISQRYKNWILLIWVLTALSLFFIFHGNALGEGEPQQIQAQITNVEIVNGKHKYKTIDMEFDMQPYHMSRNVNINSTYKVGQTCIITYHEGQFGWNVIDSVKPAD